MKDQDILNRVTQQLTLSAQASPTPAGQNKPDITDALIGAINEAFAIFRVNYHNQFQKAYPDLDTLNFAKRLWASELATYPAQAIVQSARQLIQDQEFLPTLHAMVRLLKKPLWAQLGLPDVHAAFVEACRAPSPKASFQWSHPAVYFAGRASDWFFLASAGEEQSLPVFKRNYEMICERVLQGEDLELPLAKALPSEISRPLDKNAQLAHMRALREQIKL
jgi:hypothetical protein